MGDAGGDTRIPVTVLTGYLGAGKTTLLRRILGADHGQRWAVIVNEFGAIGIDAELLGPHPAAAQDGPGGELRFSSEELFEMNNGCVCCTVRGDLIRTVHALLQRPQPFDAIVVETTGLADPGPVAQTFFVDPQLRARTRLDSITTVVDARHVGLRLADSREAQEQIAFADQIVINKTDLVDAAQLQAVEQALRRLNPLAPLHRARHGDVPLQALLGRAGFDLQRIETLDPGFLHPAHGEPGHVHDEHCDHAHGAGDAPRHDAGIVSVSLHGERPMDAARVRDWLAALLAAQGGDILRAKGIVDVAGDDRRMVFQAVHMLLDGDWQRRWAPGERRQSRLVFIGRHLDPDALRAGFAACAADVG